MDLWCEKSILLLQIFNSNVFVYISPKHCIKYDLQARLLEF